MNIDQVLALVIVVCFAMPDVLAYLNGGGTEWERTYRERWVHYSTNGLTRSLTTTGAGFTVMVLSANGCPRAALMLLLMCVTRVLLMYLYRHESLI